MSIFGTVRSSFAFKCFFARGFATQQTLCSEIKFENQNLRKNTRKEIEAYNELLTNPKYKQHYSLCQELEIDLKNLQTIQSFLKYRPEIIKNRSLLLKEMGVATVNPYLITKLGVYMQHCLYTFQKKYNIPGDQNFAKNLLANVDEKLEDTKITVADTIPAGEIYMQCLEYLVKRLVGEVRPVSMKRFAESIKYKSFVNFKKTIETLKNDIKLDEKFLKNNLYITTFDLVNVNMTVNILKDIQISGKTWVNLIKRCPSLLSADADNLIQLLDSFKLYNIPMEAIWSCPSILVMEHSKFIENMDRILKHPVLSVWSQHPRVFQLIVYQRKVDKRIEDLKASNRLEYSNIHHLCSPMGYFNKYMMDMMNNTTLKKFLQYVLCKELGADKTDLFDLIVRHSCWRRISLYKVHDTIVNLKKHFTADEICENIQIILYPWSVIESTIEIVNKEYLMKEGYHFTRSQKLALCLYTMEKSNHFSGDAVWEVDVKAPSKSWKYDNKNEQLQSIQNFDMYLDKKFQCTVNS